MVLEFVKRVLRIGTIPVELRQSERLAIQRGHQNAVLPKRRMRRGHLGEAQKKLLIVVTKLRAQRHVLWQATAQNNNTAFATPTHQLQI